ncbi:uncharacterized protein si:ch211-214p13.7 [Engraulis encrasicolus]|uniref:uncharacterized protein si:ch211-214p13.7 n=1 Tax=Engraulis encrasicolus TaxID=184585 RepID=UPI002FD1E6C2
MFPSYYIDVDTANGDSPTTEAQPTEDVLYATIDHGNSSCKRGKNEAARAVEVDDCDYAIVRIPTKGMVKIKEDGSDDYVLMG